MPNFSEMIYEYVKSKSPEPVGTADLMKMFEAEGIEANKSSISATLTGMPGVQSRPGVVKLGPGSYAYRPATPQPAEQPTQQPTPRRGSIGSQIVSYFENGGSPTATTRELADALGLTTKQAAQAAGYLVTNDVRFERLSPGLIEFNPNAVASSNGAKSRANKDAFAPVVESISHQAWSEVGMNVVGRTKDGDLLAIDERGTAWAVSVNVTAKLV